MMINSKIKSIIQLRRIIVKLKKQGKRIVFTNGCYDLLHLGHVKYLEDAKKNGDTLVVAVNSDASVRRIKGSKRPLVKEPDRLRIIAGLESVDYVIRFNADTPIGIIKSLRPDVLIKGADWGRKQIVGAKFVLGYGGRVKRIKLIPGRSTSSLIHKIAKIF